MLEARKARVRYGVHEYLNCTAVEVPFRGVSSLWWPSSPMTPRAWRCSRPASVRSDSPISSIPCKSRGSTFRSVSLPSLSALVRPSSKASPGTKYGARTYPNKAGFVWFLGWFLEDLSC
ncbi:hypothetical protein CEXT_605891 [Caerostris extrusa]|uniref:Uncharacterized protein n=1 Tax=Caerostris extrusa TaxID=172846 RepID=A0AAV4WLF5_CAEEX|nr:hypothetical protein CEXT_605891 [Caerostris extrusa]